MQFGVVVCGEFCHLSRRCFAGPSAVDVHEKINSYIRDAARRLSRPKKGDDGGWGEDRVCVCDGVGWDKATNELSMSFSLVDGELCGRTVFAMSTQATLRCLATDFFALAPPFFFPLVLRLSRTLPPPPVATTTTLSVWTVSETFTRRLVECSLSEPSGSVWDISGNVFFVVSTAHHL